MMSLGSEEFTVKELSPIDVEDVPRSVGIFEKWDEAISVIFDSLFRKDLIIVSTNYENDSHTFGFNSDSEIVSVDHNCFDGESCKYNNLELLNR